jgi:hypothetical protein
VISDPIEIELTRVGSMLAKLNEETDPLLAAYFELLQAAASQGAASNAKPDVSAVFPAAPPLPVTDAA